MFLEDCKILENVEVAKNMYLMKLKGTKAIPETVPGQFFMLQCKNSGVFLRRPISIHYINKKESVLEFYYEVKGKGTKDLSAAKTGDYINIQGPLGNGFIKEGTGKKVLVIGGGMGIAPMKYLLEELNNLGSNITFIAGGRNSGALKILDNIDLNGITTHITTDDGSQGTHGRVDMKMRELLEKERYDLVYTCGPEKMMESVAKIAAENNIKCLVSLEARMACGVKACVGCSIKTKDGMKKVCHDGPVFDSTIIVEMNPKEKSETCCGN